MIQKDTSDKFNAVPKDFVFLDVKKNEADLWNILGRPLEKARKYISDPSQAPKGAKVQRGKKGGYYYEAEPVRTSLKVQPEEVKSAVKDMFSEGMDAKMIASELESKHGIKVHPETVNRFLEREGMEVRPKRETVSRRDVEAQQKTIEEQAKQIEDMSGEIETLKDDVEFYKEKYTALDKENAAMKQEIANLKAAVEALKTRGGEETTEAESEHATTKPEQEKEPEPPKMEENYSKTRSGKNAKDVPVKMVISGDTFAIKDALKSRGYKWDGTNWGKETNLYDARDEVKQLTLDHVIKPDKIDPILQPIDDDDRKDCRNYMKDHVRNLYEKPGETFVAKLKELGYAENPKIPKTSYKFVDGKAVVDKSRVTDIIQIGDVFKYNKEHPKLKLPEYEGGIEGLEPKAQKYIRSLLESN